MLRCVHRLLPFLLAGALAVNSTAAGFAAPSASPRQEMDDVYAKCQVADEEAFRARIAEISGTAMRKGLEGVDYQALVKDQWRALGMDSMIDRKVEAVAQEVREETAWSSLIASLADTDQARELARAVAERVYRSDEFKEAVGTLSTQTGREIGQSIELAALDAAVPATRCVRAFLGNKYGSAIGRIVSQDTATEFDMDSAEHAAKVGGADIALAGSEAIAGSLILIVRRMLVRMARRVGQRIVGAVLSRVVSVIAGGVGVVLIAKDMWDLRHGVMPIIVTEMKSEESKDSVRKELASAIGEQMQAQVDTIAASTADRIVEIWREFRAAHAKVVELAEKHEPFQAFLDSVEDEQLLRVDRVVALVLASEGEAGIRARLRDGTLDEAVKRLPEEALEIGRDVGSMEAAIAWHRLAGARLPKVAEYEIHRRAQARQFSEATLDKVLALEDRLAIQRLAELDAKGRDVLVQLPRERLISVARTLTGEELDALSSYVQGLTKGARDRVLNAVADNPRKMRKLSRPGVRKAVLNSRDQGAALSMMLRSEQPFNVFALKEDVELALEGRVDPVLVWKSHPYAVVAMVVLLVILLMILNRLLPGGRRKTKS